VRVIIRTSGDELLLIKQVLIHAALAERIIAAWRRDDFPSLPRHDEILVAARRHDDGWIDEDEAPLVNAQTGALLDYVNAPDDIRRGIWPRGVERLSASPYVAALVAQHALHLFDKYRGDPEWGAVLRSHGAVAHCAPRSRRAEHRRGAPPRLLLRQDGRPALAAVLR
jgi:hypothetical protein